MEFRIPYFPIAFAFLFLFTILKTAKKFLFEKSKRPPGPWQLPFIGNIHQLLGSLPHHILKDLANKYGPLMSLKLGEVSAVVVSSPEIAEEILKTNEIKFAQRPHFLAGDIVFYNSSDIFFSPYGDYWREVRKICTLEVFSLKSVQKFQTIRKEEVLNLLKLISQNEGSAINLTGELLLLTIGVTSRVAFGKKIKDKEAFASFLKEVTELASGFSIADMYPSVKIFHVLTGDRRRLEKRHTQMEEILGDIIGEHRDNKREVDHQDIIDVLLKIQDDGYLDAPLTDDNIKAVALDIISAGSETSSLTMTWAMSEMLNNPKVMKRAQAEVREVFKGKENFEETELHKLNYLKLVIKETLRLHPPAPLLVSRECREQCQINGFNIPAKTKVVVNAWAIARDPKYWDDAEKFIPERFENSSVDFKGTDFKYIPFGAGRRMCPGMLFALSTMELPLAQMLYHFDWKVPEELKNQDLDMAETFGVTSGRKQHLYAIPVAYNPSPME